MGASGLAASIRRTRLLLAVLLAVVMAAVVLVVLDTARQAQAGATLPAGFQEKTVFADLNVPTSVEFSSDGRVFVAEKSGLIKVFDSLTDPEPSIYADLRTEVYHYWDRGLLGMALHPNFPADPRIYVLYTRNAELGGVAPRWPSPNGTDDDCPTPPGPTDQGCLVSGRLSVLVPAVQARGAQDGGAVNEQPLVDDWCTQFPSHHIGTLAFGADGMLYAGGGDGASFTYTDYGQKNNACGDPPKPAGTPLTAPTAQGGALRSQDMRTPGDPTSLAGSIIRINPDNGRPAPGNPTTTGDDNARRIIAYGMRNPFRFTVKPGTNELWVGDVGYNSWEEIDRIPNPTAKPRNFGWPCYEGRTPERGFEGASLNLCKNLYAAGPDAVSAPYFQYKHGQKVVPTENCGVGSTSVTGVAFYTGATYPAHYKGALFFADYNRGCIWAIRPGPDGLPDRSKIEPFAGGINGPIELETGPNGDLFGVDVGGKIVRYVYNGTNNPPVAAIKSDVTSGPLNLTVRFDATGSTDADGNPLTYSWDLDGDGTYGDATGATASHVYTARGRVKVGLKVDDGHGGTDHVTTPIYPGSTPPTATITSPGPGTRWKVGDRITFSGTGTDAEDGTLGGGRLDWQTIMHHCPAGCHEHVITGSQGGGGRFVAPDHENPSWIELRLTVRDGDGQTDTKSVGLYPRNTDLTLASEPPGVPLTMFDRKQRAPFTRPVIARSTVSVAAPTGVQWLAGYPQVFAGWSDGKPSAHNLVAPVANTTLTAAYRRLPNLALRRPVRAKSVEGPRRQATKAVDGRRGTRWASRRTAPQWIQVDLGARKRVGRVVLRWQAYAKRYRILVSSNGRTWSRVHVTGAGDGGVDNIVFPGRTARYVRVQGDIHGTPYGCSLWEFEVYAR